MSERKPFIYSDYAFGGNIVVGNVVKDELENKFQSKALKKAARGVGSLIGTDVTHEALLRNVLTKEGVNRHVTRLSCRLGIATLLDKEQYSQSIDTANPPEEFQSWKGEMSWGDWLTKFPQQGGPTKKQFAEVLEWNLGHMIEENNARAAELQAIPRTYMSQVEKAVDEGTLSPEFGGKAAEIIPSSLFIVRDPLHVDFHGATAYEKANLVILERKYDAGYPPHEGTHLVGGFKKQFVNEVATDIIAHVLDPRALSDEEKSTYIFMERVLTSTLDKAQISPYDISQIYVGAKPKDNEEKLRTLVEKRVGEDELGIMNKKFSKRKKYWLPRFLFNSSLATMVSGIELLKEQEQNMSIGDIIHRDLPIIDSEKLFLMEQAITTMSDKKLTTIVRDVFRAKKDSK